MNDGKLEHKTTSSSFRTMLLMLYRMIKIETRINMKIF
jgi:hypothetical protein